MSLTLNRNLIQKEEIFNLFRKILTKKKSFYYDRSYLNIPWILVTASAEIKKTYILKAGNKAIISIDGKPSIKGYWSVSSATKKTITSF